MVISESRKLTAKLLRSMWLATNGPCQRCGSWEDLTVDHIDPKTKHPRLRRSGGGSGGTQKIWYWSEVARATELAKCQPLCLTCHRVKSHAENTRDRLELDRRKADLHRKATMLRFSQDEQRKAELLNRHMTLEPELESSIEAIRRKYGQEVELPVRAHEEAPEEWPTGLIVWPF